MDGNLYELSLFVRVHDEAALWTVAFARGVADGAFASRDSADCYIGTKTEPDVEGCIQMILDPGHIDDAGFNIEESAVSHLDFTDEEEGQ